MLYAGFPVIPEEADIPISSVPWGVGAPYLTTPSPYPTTAYGALPARPVFGVPAYGAPAYGVPAYGVPAYGVPAYGVPVSGYPTAALGAPLIGAPIGGLPFSGLPAPAYGAPFAGLPAAGALGHPPTIRYRRGVPILDIAFTHPPFAEVHY